MDGVTRLAQLAAAHPGAPAAGARGRARGGDGARARRGRARRRRETDELADLLATLTAVAAALRSGAVPEQAWRREGVPAPLGVPGRAALLARWPGQTGALTTVLAAAELTATLGLAPATVLDQVADSLARDAEAAGRRRAALAGPVATARLLGWLPALGLGLGVALGADPVAVLLDGGGGSALLVTGGLLLLVGHRWTARCVAEARGEADG